MSQKIIPPQDYSCSVLFRLQSGCTKHTMDKRWPWGWFTKSCCFPNTVGQLLVMFVIYSQDDRWPIAPMNTQTKQEHYTTWKDILTMVSRTARWTHDFHTTINLRNVFRHCFGLPKIFSPLTKLEPMCGKLKRRSHNAKRWLHEWPDGCTIMADCKK